MYIERDFKKYEWIDLLRGLAILNVIAVHSALNVENLNSGFFYVLNFGQMGVQLFFVVSAITLCLSMKQRNEHSLRSFYIRRFFRIAPMYYFAILLYFLWLIFKDFSNHRPFEIPSGYSPIYVVANIFFVHGLFPHGYNSSVPGGWSISTEMMFYLIFPFMYAIQRKLSIARLIIFAGLLSLTLLLIKWILIYSIQSLLISHHLLETFKQEYEFINLSILNQMSVFMVGVIVYRMIETKRTHLDFKYFFIGIVCVLMSCILLNMDGETRTPVMSFLYPCFAAVAYGILAIKLSVYAEFKSKISRMLIIIGKYSFSIYILHFLILDIVVFILKKLSFESLITGELKVVAILLCVSIATFFVAKLFYKYIESKGIEFGRRLIIREAS